MPNSSASDEGKAHFAMPFLGEAISTLNSFPYPLQVSELNSIVVDWLIGVFFRLERIVDEPRGLRRRESRLP